MALQGDFDRHRAMLQSLGVRVMLVKTQPELEQCDGLIIPGGESTTLSLLLNKHGLWDELIIYGKERPVFGTCAGLIMLSRTITREPVKTLGLIDIETARNAYGRQVDSFIDDINVNVNGSEQIIEGYFIRAPKIVALGQGVRALARHGENVVMAEQNNILVASFHPELSDNTLVHSYFISKLN